MLNRNLPLTEFRYKNKVGRIPQQQSATHVLWAVLVRRKKLLDVTSRDGCWPTCRRVNLRTKRDNTAPGARLQDVREVETPVQ